MKVNVEEIQLYERDVYLRMPFRFGSVTLTHEPEAFARVRIRTEDGKEGWGIAAEALAPKWFDKDPNLSNEENFDQLRDAIRFASWLYLHDSNPAHPFELFVRHYENQLGGCEKKGLNHLTAGLGQAILDRAVLDALCRIIGLSFFQAISQNLVKIRPPSQVPELARFDFDSFLENLRPRYSLHARHTVGLVDPITSSDLSPENRLDDGLPETLEEVIAAYGNTYFKLKVGGEIESDLERLTQITSVLNQRKGRYFVTLDGNEQYHNVAGVEELWKKMKETPALARLVSSILFIEQPIARQVALQEDVNRLSNECPVIIDESDEDLDAFARARYFGYRGVSSKQCKNIYRSLINSARCTSWNEKEGEGRFLMSGEDLTTQAGVAVQQDLALVSILGISHLERNGHHYVRGMDHLPKAEQTAFLNTHPELYTSAGDFVHLKISEGSIDIRSLDCPGFARRPDPDWSAMKRTM